MGSQLDLEGQGVFCHQSRILGSPKISLLVNPPCGGSWFLSPMFIGLWVCLNGNFNGENDDKPGEREVLYILRISLSYTSSKMYNCELISRHVLNSSISFAGYAHGHAQHA